MKRSAAALVLATLIAVTFAPAANAARRSDNDGPRAHESGGSWQCYPYCQGGTYEGRPVREWMKPDGW
jgi:Spy/CpxP family protein refolding chaperone